MSLISVRMSGKCDNLTENCQTIKHFKVDSKTFQTFKTLHSTTPLSSRWLYFSVPRSLQQKCYIISEESAVRGRTCWQAFHLTWRGVLRLTGAWTIKSDREETECWAVERFYMQPWVAAGLRSPIWEAGRAILMFRVAWWCCGVVLVLECSIHFLRRSCDVLFKSECNYSHANCKNRFMVLEIIYIFLASSTVAEVSSAGLYWDWVV